MPKPACLKCQRFYRPKKNGFFWLEAAPIDPDRAVPGTEHPEQWRPYKIWNSDLWECEGCGHQLISGHGYNPVAIQHEPKFADWLQEVKGTINDC